MRSILFQLHVHKVAYKLRKLQPTKVVSSLKPKSRKDSYTETLDRHQHEKRNQHTQNI